MLTTTADSLLDDGGRVFGPHEWGGMAVPLGDVRFDVANEGADRVERPSADRLAGEDAEPGLDHVEPRRAFGSEVKLDLGMLFQPRLHGRGRMRGRVVEHDVECVAAIAAGHALDEVQEVGPGLPGRTAPEHAPPAAPHPPVHAGKPLAPLL